MKIFSTKFCNKGYYYHEEYSRSAQSVSQLKSFGRKARTKLKLPFLFVNATVLVIVNTSAKTDFLF